YWETSASANFTAMSRIGILVRGHRIEITRESLLVDGREIPAGEAAHVGRRANIAFIEILNKIDHLIPDEVRHNPDFALEFIRGNQVKTKEGYEFVVTVATDRVNPPCLNVLSKMTKRLWPHGIVGQTADHDGVARQPCGHNGEGVIEGSFRDYEIS